MSLSPRSVLFDTAWSSLNSVILNVQRRIRNEYLSSFCLILHILVQS